MSTYLNNNYYFLILERYRIRNCPLDYAFQKWYGERGIMISEKTDVKYVYPRLQRTCLLFLSIIFVDKIHSCPTRRKAGLIIAINLTLCLR